MCQFTSHVRRSSWPRSSIPRAPSPPPCRLVTLDPAGHQSRRVDSPQLDGTIRSAIIAPLVSASPRAARWAARRPSYPALRAFSGRGHMVDGYAASGIGIPGPSTVIDPGIDPRLLWPRSTELLPLLAGESAARDGAFCRVYSTVRRSYGRYPQSAFRRPGRVELATRANAPVVHTRPPTPPDAALARPGHAARCDEPPSFVCVCWRARVLQSATWNAVFPCKSAPSSPPYVCPDPWHAPGRPAR